MGRSPLQGERPGQARLHPGRSEGKDLPAPRAEARSNRPVEPPFAIPFTRVLDLLVPGIDHPATPPARWYDERIVNVIEQVILIGVDDTSMVGAPPRGRWSDACRPTADAGRRSRRPARPDSVIVDRVGLRKLFPGCHLDEPFDKPKETGRGLHRAAAQVRRRGARDRDERPPGDHRRRLRGDADLPVQPRRLHALQPGQAVRPHGAEDPLVHPGPDRRRDGPDGRNGSSRPRWWPSGSRARPGLGARTSENFMYKTIKYYLIYTGIPINFGITVFLGFLVGTAIAGPDVLQLHDREPETVRRTQGDGGFEPADRRHDPAPGGRRGRSRLRDRRGPLHALRLEGGDGVAGPAHRAGLLHPLAASAHDRRGHRPDLRAGQPALGPARRSGSSRRSSSVDRAESRRDRSSGCRASNKAAAHVRGDAEGFASQEFEPLARRRGPDSRA